jgi:hypothetical protein
MLPRSSYRHRRRGCTIAAPPTSRGSQGRLFRNGESARRVSLGDGTTTRRARPCRRPHHHRPTTTVCFRSRRSATPQDRKYDGTPAPVIGDENVVREFVSINAGTAQDRDVTTIGNGNWLLAYSHVAHDCVIGNGRPFRTTQLAGHVVVEVTRCSADSSACISSAGSAPTRWSPRDRSCWDVPPFVTASGYPRSREA